MRTLRDNYWVNLRCVTILSCELSCNILNELVVDVVLNQVDGAATEATTHDTATSNTVLLGNIVQEVELLAAYLVFLAQTVVSLIHLLTYSLVVTLLKSIADCQYAVLLAQYEVSAAVILFAYLSANLFQLLPCAIAESLELSLWVLGSDVLNHVLARVAAVVVWRTSQLVLNLRVNQAELVTLRLGQKCASCI